MPHQRVTVDGYLFMGRARVPPKIFGIAMTDRDTGTVYWLKIVTTGGADYVAVETPVPSVFQGKTFPAFEGPQIRVTQHNETLHLRLLLRAGFLGYEVVTDARELGMRPIVIKDVEEARPATDKVYEIITVAGNFQDGDVLAYERRTTF